MATAAAQCICSHLQAEHTEDGCAEPTGRCQCPQYVELCLSCRHSTVDHNGIEGRCTRTVRKTGMPCNCMTYPTPLEGS
jgi:hypothetical protein